MNKPNPTPGQSFKRIRRAEQFVRTWTTLKSALTALALVAGALFVSQAQAQTVYFGPVPMIRATVPVGYTGLLVVSNNMTYTTNGMVPDGNGEMVIQPISVNITGLPSGVTYSLTNASTLTNIETFTATALRTNSNNTLRLWTVLSFNGSEPEGTYTYSLNASGGAAGNLFLTLDVAHIWNGSTNAITDGASKWSTTTNWQGGGSPGTSGNVIFNDLGGQTNSLVIVTGVSTNWLINSIVDSDVEVASLRFAETNAATRYHTLLINPGYTLKITGTGGFSVLRDYIDELAGIGSAITVTILGTNGTLIVSNTSANFNFLIDAQISGCLLDLSRLDTFKATVNRFSLGDYSTYPNFWNMDTNNFGNRFTGSANSSVPKRFLTGMNMARTNIIKTSFVGPDSYTNSSTRQYAVSYGSTAYGSGTTAANNLWQMGVSNMIYADSMMIGGANTAPQSNYRFNPLFATNNPILVLRGMGGDTSRMTLFTIADDASPVFNSMYSNVKDYVDYGSNNGRVDFLLDTMILATDGKGIAGGQTPNIQGKLAIGAGIIDVNTVYLGYQVSGVHTNDVSSPFLGFCQGVLTVTNTAVVKINNTLTLGYTTETNNGATTTGAETGNNRGQVDINNGGTVMANTILVGGVTKGSQQNNISLASANANISTLIVSNTIADSTQRLSTLAFGGNANMTLFIDGTLAAPYVYVTNLTTAGQNNTITIGAVKNVTYTGGTVQLPLVAYVGGNPSILGVKMPVGFVGSGSIVQNGSTEWDLYISTNAPNTNLLWRAPAGTTGTTNWDTTSKVWLDGTTGLMTNFNNGDYVRFDDTPGYATNINQAVSVLLPGQITMSNTVLKYTINGAGLQGGGILTKTGTGTLEVDGNASVAIALAQGLLTNAPTGTIGGVAVTAGATLINNGQINGGIVCAGTAINSGTLYGSLGIMSGGVVTNLSGANINGLPTFQDGSLLYNSGTIIYGLGGTMTVSSNATLINVGNITGDNISVSGTFKDAGVGSISLYNQLTIGNGGVFIPGGDGIGSTTVNGIGSATFSGRVTFLAGSTNIFKVDLDSGVNYTILFSGEQDFGPSQSTRAYNGGTLLITNIGITPFSAGLGFNMFRNSSDGGAIYITGTATNSYPIMVPAAPLPGLAWNINEIVHNGTVNIIGVNTNATSLVVSSQTITLGNTWITGYTTNNSIITTNRATNNVIFTHLNWPTNHTGWILQTQVNPLTIGLFTNWTTVFGSPWVSDMVISNNLNTNSSTFFRLVYP